MRRLPSQSSAASDHAHRRVWPGSVDTAAIVDGAVTFDKVDVSTFPSTETAEVATSESTTSTTFTNLVAFGPWVTMTPPASGKVKVYLYTFLQHDDAAGTSYMGVELSGGNTVAALNSKAIALQGASGRVGATILFSGLAAVSTTFTAKYRSSTSLSAAWFADRKIIVEPVLA